MMGTVPYMAPEQFRGDEDIDTRADVFALGMILVRLFTGRLPVEPSNIIACTELYRGEIDLFGQAQVFSWGSGELANAVIDALRVDRKLRSGQVGPLIEALAERPLAVGSPADTVTGAPGPVDEQSADAIDADESQPAEAARPAGEAKPPPAQQKTWATVMIAGLAVVALMVAGGWIIVNANMKSQAIAEAQAEWSELSGDLDQHSLEDFQRVEAFVEQHAGLGPKALSPAEDWIEDVMEEREAIQERWSSMLDDLDAFDSTDRKRVEEFIGQHESYGPEVVRAPRTWMENAEKESDEASEQAKQGWRELEWKIAPLNPQHRLEVQGFIDRYSSIGGPELRAAEKWLADAEKSAREDCGGQDVDFANHRYKIGSSRVRLSDGLQKDPGGSTMVLAVGSGEIPMYGDGNHTFVVLRHTGGNRAWETLHFFQVRDRCQEEVFIDNEQAFFSDMRFRNSCLQYLSEDWEDGDSSASGPTGRYRNTVCLEKKEYVRKRTRKR